MFAASSLTNRQKKELAKFCLDISKLLLASWVLGLFASGISLTQVSLAISGLTFALAFFILGIRLFKEVKTNDH